MLTAEIICTGTELLIGNSLDTNSVFLSNGLGESGVMLLYKTVVGDDPATLESVFRHALTRVDIIIISGGLGPTRDDLTRDILAKITGKKLVYHGEIHDRILARIRKIHPGRNFPDSVKLQAYVPEDSDYFMNQNGTAPGLAVKLNHKIIIALPGPPRELKPMWTDQVKEWLVKELPEKKLIRSRTLRTTGLPESIVDDKLHDLFQIDENIKIGFSASPGVVDIKLIGWAETQKDLEDRLNRLETQIHDRLGDMIYGTDEDTLESVVGRLLKKMDWTLSVAESCTGGLIAHRITNIPGSSGYFDRGMVTYSNRAKIEQLQVPDSIIRDRGAVSEQVAIAMVKGLLSVSRSDLALAVTGIAGPSGGTPEKPVGLVYIALADKTGFIDCRQYQFAGERELVKFRTSQEALDLIRRHLSEKSK